jgi:hypothetical protein
MKPLPWTALLFFSAGIAMGAGPETKEPSPKALAAAYFEAVIKGDLDAANAASTVPYSFDRKKVLKTQQELEEMHRDIVKKKGKREVPRYTIESTDKAPELDPKVFPAYLAFRVTVKTDQRSDTIDIYVLKESPAKVIGVSD